MTLTTWHRVMVDIRTRWFPIFFFPICGRFRLDRVDKLAGRFDIEPVDDWVLRYNIAPTQDIPSSCTDAFVSTLAHTRASATGSFETAGNCERKLLDVERPPKLHN